MSPRRKKSSPTPTDSTTTQTGTPVYGSGPSSLARSTPGTTPGLDETDLAAPKKRVVRAKASAKRLRDESSSELSDVEDAPQPIPRGGRSRREVFVEIKSSPKPTNAKPTPRPIKPLKKSTRRAGNVSEDELIDDDSDVLEYLDEGGDSDFDDGQDSGSEFEPTSKTTRARATRRRALASDAGSDDLDDDEDEDVVMLGGAMDDDEEQANLEAAIAASLTSRAAASFDGSNGAGPSHSGAASGSGSGSNAGRNKASELRALAAERRARSDNVVDDSAVIIQSDSEDEDYDSKQPRDTSMDDEMIRSLKELRRKRAKERMEKRLEMAPVRVEERALKKLLGRKITQAERTTIKLQLHHPELKNVWGDLEAKIAIPDRVKAKQPEDFKATLLPFQQESLHWMRAQELGVWGGGMLADEMGMGKTIQMLALLSSDRQKPNLIVAPTVAIMQWRNEIEKHTTGFKVCIFHGASRESNVDELNKFDVVLTTFAVLESVFRKQVKGFTRKNVVMKETSPLHLVKWHRIILDEAHNIKERSSNTAKGAFELTGKYKWCLSGTPLQNRVGELYSLVRFLGGDPFSHYFCKRCPCKSLHWKFTNRKECDDCGHSPMQHTCFWNNEILTPIQKHAMSGPGKTAFKKLKILLDRMMLRRTKVERADDLGLPPRTVIVRRDYFSEEEKELYLSLFSDAKRQFSTYVNSGTILNNYSNIFSLLTRMRQMACHPDLVLKNKTYYKDEGETEANICRICHDVAEDAIQSKCHHIFDRQCISQYIEAAAQDKPACPVCHLALSIDLEGAALEQDEEAKKKTRQGILGRLDHNVWRSSSKIEALVEELVMLRHQNSTTKSLVFSQFVSFLDLIAYRLQRAGFVICRLEGTMSPQARDATIKHFMNNVEVTVFLVSLKAGGVALNLVEASRVYLMDSWWNPAVEYQAMDRIHRLGQYRPVHAIKLVIEDSIESRIVQLQEKKSAMVDATLSTDDSAMGRLTVEDLGFLFRL